MIMSKSLKIDKLLGSLDKLSDILDDAFRRARWTPPSAAIVPKVHLPMRSYEVKNRTSTDDIKAPKLITAIKIPYLPDGRFDLEAYDSLVNMQIEDGADGVIVGCTTGEGQLMSWDEHIMLIGHTINCFGSAAIKAIGNTGSNSTREAVHATEQGFAVGMHAALHINPYYGKTSLEGMVAEDAVSISIEDLCRLSIKKEDLHLPGLIKAIKMPSSPSGRFDLKAYDSSDNGAGMLMFGLLMGIQSASATICSLMQSNEVKNRTSMEKLVPSDHQSWSIPSRCHDVTRVAVLPRVAHIFWRPKSKFKIRTLYIFVGKLRFLII